MKSASSNIDNFETLSTNISMYIKSLNFKSRSELMDIGIEYINEYAIFDSDNKVRIQWFDNNILSDTRKEKFHIISCDS